MTDQELVTFLGFDGVDPARVKRIIDGLSREKRELYERMREVELWSQGLGPRPEGVIVCRDRR